MFGIEQLLKHHMVHCTLNGLICRHKHLKDVLVEPEVDSPLSKLRGFCLLPRRACVPLNTSAFLFGRADFQAEGYQSRPFGCEVGSQFHHGTVSRGPLQIFSPDILKVTVLTAVLAGRLLRDHYLGRLTSRPGQTYFKPSSPSYCRTAP